MSPLEQGGLFHLEQGTGLLEAPPAAEKTAESAVFLSQQTSDSGFRGSAEPKFDPQA